MPRPLALALALVALLAAATPAIVGNWRLAPALLATVALWGVVIAPQGEAFHRMVLEPTGWTAANR